MKLLKKLSDMTADKVLANKFESKYKDPPYMTPLSSVMKVESLMRKFIFSEFSDFSPQIVTNMVAWNHYSDMISTAIDDESYLTDSDVNTSSSFRICGIFFKPNVNIEFEYSGPPKIHVSVPHYEEVIQKSFISHPTIIDYIKRIITLYKHDEITLEMLNSIISVNNKYDIYCMVEDITCLPSHYIKNFILYKYDMTNYKEEE